MKATATWLSATSRKYLAGASSTFVHLGKYTAELYESGSGSPIVLIPGLAGGHELLGPLAQLLAADHQVFSYQLRGENDCFALRHPFDLDDLGIRIVSLLDQVGHDLTPGPEIR